MLLDRSERFIISAEEWLDGAAISRRDLATGAVESYRIPDAGEPRLFAFDDSRFLLCSRPDTAPILDFSVRTFDEPGTPVWSMRVSEGAQRVDGNLASGRALRRMHVLRGSMGQSWLVAVDPEGARARLTSLPGLECSDAIELDGGNIGLLCVEGSPSLLAVDAMTGSHVGHVPLPGGGAVHSVARIGSRIWMVDHDAAFCLDGRTGQPLGAVPLRAEAGPGVSGPVGDVRRFSGEISACGDRVLVPRPYHSDVAVIDPHGMAIVRLIRTGREPIRCAMTRGGRLIARDWMSGDWLDTQASS